MDCDLKLGWSVWWKCCGSYSVIVFFTLRVVSVEAKDRQGFGLGVLGNLRYPEGWVSGDHGGEDVPVGLEDGLDDIEVVLRWCCHLLLSSRSRK